jgi:hypothetical protein
MLPSFLAVERAFIARKPFTTGDNFDIASQRRTPGQQIARANMKAGVPPGRNGSRQRYQHKTARRDFRVGQGQPPGDADLPLPKPPSSIIEDIDVERPRSELAARPAPSYALYALDKTQ